MLETARRYELNLTCNYSQRKNHQFLLQRDGSLPAAFIRGVSQARRQSKARAFVFFCSLISLLSQVKGFNGIRLGLWFVWVCVF